MEITQKKKKWTETEMQKMKKYILQNENMLIAIFYKNIYEEKHIYRKRDGFFQEIAKILGRKSSECKSKFQKYEKIIYTIYLKIPIQHYDIFVYYRKIANIKNSTKPLLNPILQQIKTKIVSTMNTKYWKFKDLKNISSPLANSTKPSLPISLPNKKSMNLNKIILPSLSKRENFLDKTDDIVEKSIQTGSHQSPERSIFSILQEKRNFTFFQQNCVQKGDEKCSLKTNKILSTGLHTYEVMDKENEASISKGESQMFFNFESFQIAKSLNLDCCDLLRSDNSPSN
jgi:hypothetical protein